MRVRRGVAVEAGIVVGRGGGAVGGVEGGKKITSARAVCTVSNSLSYGKHS